eukprot:SAG11_NODE_6117_length_1385_cov_1.160964_1_plen_291_part_00
MHVPRMALLHTLTLLASLMLTRPLLGDAQTQKVIYGDDDRLDESAVPSSLNDALSAVGRQTVALFKKTKLLYEADRNSFVHANVPTLGASFSLCEGQLFASQPTPAFCSGTVVQWDDESRNGLVATAGHCFDSGSEDGCQDVEICDTLFVFDFTDASVVDEAGALVIPAANVFDCAEVLACDVRRGASLSPHDYAIARISANLADFSALESCPTSWENDGVCDVPVDCPDGTDLADCEQDPSYDTAERQVRAANRLRLRTVSVSFYFAWRPSPLVLTQRSKSSGSAHYHL